MSHHPSCRPNDKCLESVCGQCGEREDMEPLLAISEEILNKWETGELVAYADNIGMVALFQRLRAQMSKLTTVPRPIKSGRK